MTRLLFNSTTLQHRLHGLRDIKPRFTAIYIYKASNTDRHADRHADRHTHIDRQPVTQTESHMDRQTSKIQTDTDRQRLTRIHTDIWTRTWTDKRKTDKPSDRQTNSHMDRQTTDRQIETHIQTGTWTDKQTVAGFHFQ